MTTDLAEFGMLTEREQQLVDLAAERAARAVLAELVQDEPKVSTAVETFGKTTLVTAAQLAQRLGVSRDFVYEHSDEFGGKHIGNGERGRLRFDLVVALERWRHHEAETRPPESRQHIADFVPATRRRAKPHTPPLLPIRGRE